MSRSSRCCIAAIEGWCVWYSSLKRMLFSRAMLSIVCLMIKEREREREPSLMPPRVSPIIHSSFFFFFHLRQLNLGHNKKTAPSSIFSFLVHIMSFSLYGALPPSKSDKAATDGAKREAPSNQSSGLYSSLPAAESGSTMLKSNPSAAAPTTTTTTTPADAQPTKPAGS